MSYKKLAQKLEPRLKGFTEQVDGKNLFGVKLRKYRNETQIGNLEASEGQAWENAYHHYNAMLFKENDCVVMHNCPDSLKPKYTTNVLQCYGDAFKNDMGDWVVFLGKEIGYFPCEYLRRFS